MTGFSRRHRRVSVAMRMGLVVVLLLVVDSIGTAQAVPFWRVVASAGAGELFYGASARNGTMLVAGSSGIWMLRDGVWGRHASPDTTPSTVFVAGAMEAYLGTDEGAVYRWDGVSWSNDWAVGGARDFARRFFFCERASVCVVVGVDEHVYKRSQQGRWEPTGKLPRPGMPWPRSSPCNSGVWPSDGEIQGVGLCATYVAIHDGNEWRRLRIPRALFLPGPGSLAAVFIRNNAVEYMLPSTAANRQRIWRRRFDDIWVVEPTSGYSIAQIVESNGVVYGIARNAILERSSTADTPRSGGFRFH